MSIFTFAQKTAQKLLGVEPKDITYSDLYEVDESLLTPSQLSDILNGDDMIAKAKLWEAIETKDAVIHSCLQTRKLAVAGKSYEIVPASNKLKDKKIAEFVKETFENITDFEYDIADLLDAVGKGFSVLLVDWQIVDGKRIPVDMHWIPQWKFNWNTEGKFGYTTKDGEFRAIDDYPGWFLVHNYRGRSAHPSRQGVLYVVAWMFLFKRYALRNWTMANEIVGMPLRYGKYPQGATDNDIKKLKAALKNMGVDAWAVVSEGTEIEFIEPKSRGDISKMFGDFIELANKEISKAILGQTATIEGTAGKLGNETAREQVRQDLIASDARSVMRTIQGLINNIVRINFGDALSPKFVLRYEPQEDLQNKANVLVALSKIGMGFPESWLRETFGIPAPKEGENIVQPLVPMKDGTEIEGLQLKEETNVIKMEWNSDRYIELKEQNPDVSEYILRDYVYREKEIKEDISKVVGAYDMIKKVVNGKAKKAKNLKDLRRKIADMKQDDKVVQEIAGVLLSAMKREGNRGYSTVFEKYNARRKQYAMKEYAFADNSTDTISEAEKWWNEVALSVAGIENEQVLEQLHEEIRVAIADGETLNEFRDRLDDIFDNFGITETNPYHIETVFRTNTSTAYMSGKYFAGRELGDKLWGYEYVAVMDSRTRDEHAALHGTRAPKNDKIWDDIWPPNGFNCRCDVDEIYDFESERHEALIPESIPQIDFRGNVAIDHSGFVNWKQSK